MAKQIVAWCDVHMAQGENVPGTSIRVGLNGRPERELDLCEPCIKELVDPLADLLDEAGQPVMDDLPKVTKDGKKPYALCPECGSPSRTRDTLSKHLKRMHDKQITDDDVARALNLQLGTPMLPAAAAPVTGDMPYACPDCSSTFATPQGMGAHRNKTHGYRAGDDAKR